jgi:hypothetical protein
MDFFVGQWGDEKNLFVSQLNPRKTGFSSAHIRAHENSAFFHPKKIILGKIA